MLAGAGLCLATIVAAASAADAPPPSVHQQLDQAASHFDQFDEPVGGSNRPLFTEGGDDEEKQTAQTLAEQQRGQTQWRRQRQIYRYKEGAPEPLSNLAVGRPVQPGRNGVTLPNEEFDETYTVGTGGAGIPPVPEAAPGQCFALVRKPAAVGSLAHSYQLRPASDRLKVQPAVIQQNFRSYTTQGAVERLEIAPATSRTVTEVVEVAPPQTRYVAAAPRYRTETRRVEVEGPRTVWQNCRGPIERYNEASGQVECLVDLPPVYQTLTRQVSNQANELHAVQTPGTYKTITRRVLDQPEHVVAYHVPGQTATVMQSRTLEPAQVSREPVPASYASYSDAQIVPAAQLEWRDVLCQSDMTPGLVNRVQEVLNQAGFNAGPVDGEMGEQTLDALNAYQRAHHLPQDRYLNRATAESLGLYGYR